jgi:hypothetical protein
MTNLKDIAWVAGIIEGEGYFDLASKTSYPRITVAMCDLDVVIRFAEITGARTVRTKKNSAGVKQQYHARVQGAQAIGWLMTIYALMGERRKAQIRHLLETWKANKQRTAGAGRVVKNSPFFDSVLKMARQRISQDRIAEAHGVSQPVISKILRGGGIRVRDGLFRDQATVMWHRLPAAVGT